MAKKRCNKKDDIPKEPKYECKKCGTKAKKKKHVCKPGKIKK
jgi:hypothetical protein